MSKRNRDLIGPRMSSFTLSDEALKMIEPFAKVAEADVKERAETFGVSPYDAGAPAVAEEPVKRTTFFDLSEYQYALHHLDGWGFVEEGVSRAVVARYKHFATSGQAKNWPVTPHLLHAVVDKALQKAGKPRVLVALLRHRYPREGKAHRGSYEAFIHEDVMAFQELTSATDGEIGKMLEAIEKRFVRTLNYSLSKRRR